MRTGWSWRRSRTGTGTGAAASEVLVDMNVTSFVCGREAGHGATGLGRRRRVHPQESRSAMLRTRLDRASDLYGTDLVGHFGCVNAVEFAPAGDRLASGGDDHRVLIWDLAKAVDDRDAGEAADGDERCNGENDAINGKRASKKRFIRPHEIMTARHTSNIFCLSFDRDVSRVFSGGNDEQVIVHDLNTGSPLDVFTHDEPVYCISSHPANTSLFATACSDGRVQLFDLRAPSSDDPLAVALLSSPFHAVDFNPAEPRLLCTANHKNGVGLWDVRRPQKLVMEYGSLSGSQTAMSAKFDGSGRRIAALRRRLPAVLFDVEDPEPRCEFDHPGYYNSCTMKSCSFAGDDDQFVMSGSDDFNVYVWRIPDDPQTTPLVHRAHLTLTGHRSIVNQVRFNKSTCTATSAGVEKVVKLWSTLPFPGGVGGVDYDPSVHARPPLGRTVFSREEYVRLALGGGGDSGFMSHDYSGESTEENVRMLAFFDSLVQRELRGGGSDSSSSSDEDEDDLSAGSPRHRRRRGEAVATAEEDDRARTVTSFVELEGDHNDPFEAEGRSRRISHLIARRRHQLAASARSTTCGNSRGSVGNNSLTWVQQERLRRALLRAKAVTAESSSAGEIDSDSDRDEDGEGSSDDDLIEPRRPRRSSALPRRRSSTSATATSSPPQVEVPVPEQLPADLDLGLEDDESEACDTNGDERDSRDPSDSEPGTSRDDEGRPTTTRPQFKGLTGAKGRNYRKASGGDDGDDETGSGPC